MIRFGIFAILLVLAPLADARAEDWSGEKVAYDYVFAADASYVQTVTIDARVRTPEDLQSQSQRQIDFDPASSSVHLIEAWVEEPDGSREVPEANAIITRPSAAAQASPGFVSSQTKTIIMPQLRVGSRVHVKYEIKVRALPPFGFNEAIIASSTRAGELSVSMRLPVGLQMTVAQRGGFEVSDTSDGTLRHINATVRLDHPIVTDAEPYSVSMLDVVPMFLMTTLKSYEEMGALYYRNSIGKSAATPEIKALAQQIVGDRTGIDAARAIHDWVAGNIRYLAVWLGNGTTLIPHDAPTVLKNGYGDCKDHVALMQALLGAVNIRSAPALVNWGNVYKPLPLWVSNVFTHAMIYLPDFDLYANPTSPFTPIGVLDRYLSGKMVVIAGETSEVRTTPALTPEMAALSFRSKIAIGPDGTVTGAAAVQMAPATEVIMREKLASNASAASQMTSWVQAMPEGGFGQIRTSPPHDLDKPFLIDMAWRSPNATEKNAPYMLLPAGPNPSPLPLLMGYLTPSGKRSLPMDIGVADITWMEHVALPGGRALRGVPQNVHLENEVALYSATYEADGPQIRVKRRLVFKQSIVAPERYPDLEAVIYAALGDRRVIIALDGP